MREAKDRAVTCGYSLRRSHHAALRLLATHAGHNNKTRVLDQILEAYLVDRFGHHWQAVMEPQLALSSGTMPREPDDERMEAFS